MNGWKVSTDLTGYEPGLSIWWIEHSRWMKDSRSADPI